MENQQHRRVTSALCGIAAGAVNGLLGTGGGILLIPLFSRILKLEPKPRFSTALAVMLPLTAVSAVSYTLLGNGVSVPLLLPYLIGGMLGGFLGGKLMHKIPQDILRLLFSLLLIFGGIRSLIV